MTNATKAKPVLPKITMHAIVSQQIAERGYDPETKTLAVRFLKGGTYHYHDFTQKHWDAFLAAKSAGSFFHTHIRDKFKFTPPEQVKATEAAQA